MKNNQSLESLVDELEPQPEGCEICGGALIPMGFLGIRMHVLCQNCGMWFSRKEY